MHAAQAEFLVDLQFDLLRSEFDCALVHQQAAPTERDDEPTISEDQLAEACMLAFDRADWTIPQTCKAIESAYLDLVLV
jgi:hypothetical protein